MGVLGKLSKGRSGMQWMKISWRTSYGRLNEDVRKSSLESSSAHSAYRKEARVGPVAEFACYGTVTGRLSFYYLSNLSADLLLRTIATSFLKERSSIGPSEDFKLYRTLSRGSGTPACSSHAVSSLQLRPTLSPPDIIMTSDIALINELPYDVLCSIFVACLPQFRGSEDRQPNLAVAPILLCHVCSHWRKVALCSPVLWSHLSFKLSIQQVGTRLVNPWAVFRPEFEFLRWWKENQGSAVPFLSFRIVMLRPTGKQRPHHLLLSTQKQFIIDYMEKAQYLAADVFYWKLCLEWMKKGQGKRIAFPNLHTLVRNEDTHRRNFDFRFEILHSGPIFYEFQQLVDYKDDDGNPAIDATASRLQRLCIVEDTLIDGVIPTRWSTLTHIFLSKVDITVKFWYAFIPAVRYVQKAYVNIRKLQKGPNPGVLNATLPYLESLFLEVYDRRCSDGASLITLFTNLHLPALRLLSLASYNDFRSPHLILEDIKFALSLTPSIEKVALRGNFLGLSNKDIDMQTRQVLAHAEPIWIHSTFLKELEFELGWVLFPRIVPDEADKALYNFIGNTLISNNRWLDLTNPACTIEKITIVDRSFVWLDEQYAAKCRRELSKLIPNVEFEITLESESKKAHDVWGYDELKIYSMERGSR
ncbi:hypothetical protein BDN70DRAFT_921371 [Pholiota conissans]|uniref:F-box domain-containing protein n=1 Tax=Pholiota conissans TaxID=109636 RepID=A0A9P5Z206_9AGAR|nr:hypothetical protein BDN70DRAFT_921371 [Pholiota conissans]